MEQDPELSVVNEMITRSVIDPESETALNDAKKEAVVKEAERLPLHWLRAAAKRTTQASMSALVHSTQKLIVYR